MLVFIPLCVIFYFAFYRIKNDDKLIQSEGVESLSEAELREDCRERGMLGLLSVKEMRQQVCGINLFYISLVHVLVKHVLNGVGFTSSSLITCALRTVRTFYFAWAVWLFEYVEKNNVPIDVSIHILS